MSQASLLAGLLKWVFKVTFHNAKTTSHTGDVASYGVSKIDGYPISNWTKEDLLTTYGQTLSDVVIKSFENGKVINGKEALVARFTYKLAKGSYRDGALVAVTDGVNNYLVNFIYNSDNIKGALAVNLQSCIDSVKFVETKK